MASEAKKIADACVTLAGGIASPPSLIVHRKADVTFEGDAKPSCIIWIDREELDSWQTMGGSDRTIGKRYVIGVAIYRAASGQLQTNIDKNPDMVLSIKKAIGGPTLSGVPSVWDTTLGPHSEFEKEIGKDVESSKFFIEFRTAESPVS